MNTNTTALKTLKSVFRVFGYIFGIMGIFFLGTSLLSIIETDNKEEIMLLIAFALATIPLLVATLCFAASELLGVIMDVHSDTRMIRVSIKRLEDALPKDEIRASKWENKG
jgi:hypothetical protein